MAITVVKKHPDVLLVSMPFASCKQPSLALSIFKSILKDRGVRSRVQYFTLAYAELAGRWLYEKIGTWHLPDLLGDWIFAGSLFSSALPGWEEYVAQVLNSGSPEHKIDHFGKEQVAGFLLEQLLKLREETPSFLSRCVEVIDAIGPRVLGLTSGVHQHGASLALAKAVKAALPHIFIVMGGTNCTGVMGLETARQFPLLDAVVSGEGELVFPELVVRVLAGKPVGSLEGVFSREEIEKGDTGQNGQEDSTSIATSGRNCPEDSAPVVSSLDALPYPDYSDFVEQWDSRRLPRDRGRLLLETSRGCYWGQRVRCTFCGQASPSLRYRAKSPGRVAEELAHLVQKWPGFQLCLTDEAVDQGVVAELASRRDGDSPLPEIVYIQVRPDLGKQDIIRLRKAGVQRLEAGIETFSTGILGLMRKGTRGIHNIAFLKWCRELGIEVVWNLLWGFPGEPPAAYTAMADLLPLLFHLDPPHYAGPVRLERFSPMFADPAGFGLNHVEPYPAYYHIYPFSREVVNKLAYYFTFRHDGDQAAAEYTAPLAEIIDLWKRHRGNFLDMYDDGRRLLIVDGRSPFGPPRKIVLEGLERLVYRACEEVKREAKLEELAREKGVDTTPGLLSRTLLELVGKGLLIRERDMYLSLAVPHR